jgi:multidrug efflux pump subunit AcrA (membrane-fusion protein)
VTDQLSSDLASLRIERDAPSGPSPVRRALVPLLAVAGVGALGYVAYAKLEGQLFKQEVRTTEVAMISPSQAEVQVTATGYVIPQRTSKVGSKLPGRLAKVLVKEGDTVHEGDVIAQLEDTDIRTQVVAAGSRVGAARASTTSSPARRRSRKRCVPRRPRSASRRRTSAPSASG